MAVFTCNHGSYGSIQVQPWQYSSAISKVQPWQYSSAISNKCSHGSIQVRSHGSIQAQS